MTDRIVVLDDFIDLGTLRETLGAAGIDVGVEFSSEIPSGAGIIALLVGPETVGLDAHHLDSLPDLRLLAATSAGFDHLPVARRMIGASPSLARSTTAPRRWPIMRWRRSCPCCAPSVRLMPQCTKVVGVSWSIRHVGSQEQFWASMDSD